MSATINENAIDAVSNQGEFKSRVQRSHPLTTKGHKPGVENTASEFHAETCPAGTVPEENSFTSKVETPETVPQSLKADFANGVGTDSAAVHTGLGHPGQGQTSAELHHDGHRKRERQRQGLEGVGATVQEGENANRQQNLEDKGQPVEERLPETAESIFGQGQKE